MATSSLDSSNLPPHLRARADQAAGDGAVAGRAGDATTDDNATAGVQALHERLRKDRMTRLALAFLDRYDGVHLKDVVVDWMDDQRTMSIGGHAVVNFGSDSFLGLDRHAGVQQAIRQAMDAWGTHNGASRAFTNAAICEEAERRLARWLGVEDTLIYTSVTLANAGLLPAVAGEGDLLVLDRQSHDSLHQAARIAVGNGARLVELKTADPGNLERVLSGEKFNGCVVAVDGVYSMTGVIPDLAGLDRVVRKFGGVLYVDDAHGTGVVGPGGRGAAYQALGRLDHVLMVGSLSKAFSCLGGFVTCGTQLKRILKIRSSTFVFGGPVPPPYLGGVCAVCDVLESDEHSRLIEHLNGLIRRLCDGLRANGWQVLGGETPIVSMKVGEIETTFEAGKWLFDRGFYVQSATYPAVPISGGLLRIQLNANHTVEQVDRLLNAISEMADQLRLPVARERR